MRTRTAMSVAAAALLAAAAGITLTPDASAAPAIGRNGRIAYSKTVSGNTDVYTIKADGTGQVRLTTATGADTLPAYSASGLMLVYVRQPTSTAVRELWTMHADGTAKRKITTINTDQTCPPQYSPDGKRIAFTQTVSGNRRIWTVAADGTTKRQAITPPPNSQPSKPQDDCAKWSPSPGAGLAYIRSGFDGPNGSGDAVLGIRINTGTTDRGTPCGFTWGQQGYDFAPDGSALVLAGTPSEYDFGICDLTPAGGASQPQEFHGGYGPAWSPDGRYIAVGADDGIHLVRTDGSGGIAWLRVETQTIRSLSWQPVR